MWWFIVLDIYEEDYSYFKMFFALLYFSWAVHVSSTWWESGCLGSLPRFINAIAQRAYSTNGVRMYVPFKLDAGHTVLHKLLGAPCTLAHKVSEIHIWTKISTNNSIFLCHLFFRHTGWHSKNYCTVRNFLYNGSKWIKYFDALKVKRGLSIQCQGSL